MPDQTVTAVGAIVTREAAARIVERTDLPLKLIDEEENDPVGMLGLMLEGNLRGYLKRSSAERAPTQADLKSYFGKVEAAAAALISVLGMQPIEDDPPKLRASEVLTRSKRKWKAMQARYEVPKGPTQHWAREWQRIKDPPQAMHQREINRPLFRLLREARHQQASLAQLKKKTKAPAHDRRWLIRDLAGIFEAAFGTRPTVTRQGSFVRFVLAYVDAVEPHVTLPGLSSDSIVEILKLPNRRK